MPCYTYQRKNIVMVSAFKEYCSLSFFKGSLLKDPHSILVKPGANSQATRQFRVTNKSEILKFEPVLRSYIFEAIELEKAGIKIDFKEKEDLVYPEELINRLSNDPMLKEAFESLTPGRKRGYALFFAAPKQSQTRESRIENCIPKILMGKGYNDQ
jgi:uncharacterized protein YdeI (YjbR/CyaY-like superfamily)